MTSPILISVFLGALVLAAALTPLVYRWCQARGLTRHGKPARLGGLALAAAFGIPMVAALAWWPPTDDLSHIFSNFKALTLGLCGLTVLSLGVWDDLKKATPFEKLCVQIIVAVATWMVGVRIDAFTGVTGETLTLSPWMSAPLTVLWIVGLTNAVNLLDGLDGLAAGISLIAVATLFALGWADHHVMLCLVCAALGGSLLGFLVYNFNPARIFMGDSGALLLGYILAVASILSTTKQYTAWALALPVLALGLPIMDTLFAVVRRLRSGRPVTSGDNGHVHHRLLRAGYSHRQAVLYLYGIGALLAAIALTLKAHHDGKQALLLGVTGAIAFGLIHLLKRHSTTPSATRMTVAEATRRRLMSRAIRTATTPDALWRATLRGLLAEGAIQVRVDLYTRPASGWQYWQPPGPAGVHTLIVPLMGEIHCFGELRVTRSRTADPALDTQRDIEIHVLAESLVAGLSSLAQSLDNPLVVVHLPAP